MNSSNLFSNYILNVAASSWLAAQILKFFLNWFVSKEFNFERLIGSGGMPSSHSAFVTALSIATYQKCGFSSPEFAIAFCISIIVMYDAMGVRRAAGEQAKKLNYIMSEMIKDGGDPQKLQSNLKEFLGHTPLQVIAGIILGTIISVLF